MGCCGHWHGPSCWYAGHPSSGYHRPPPPPTAPWQRRLHQDEEQDLEAHLRYLEEEIHAVRRRLEELHEARRSAPS